MFHEKKKMVPPDGGWGWIVVIGVSIVNLCTRSIEQSFGLLFGDLLSELGVETTGAAIIMSTLDALINFSGLLVGPLIRTFSFRKVSLCGTALCSLGLILTFPANSMPHILVTYSIINGLGVGLAASSTFVALSNYFLKRRGQAVGYSLAGTALGMMVMPQAVRCLLEWYNFRGAILVLGAFAMNGIVGSSVLQPVEWHLVPEEKDKDEEGGYHQEMETIKETEDEDNELPEAQNLLSKVNSEAIIKNPEDPCKPGGLTRKSTFPRNFSTVSFAGGQRKRKISNSESLVSSYSRLDFTGSSIQLQFDSKDSEEPLQFTTSRQIRRNLSYPGVMISQPPKISAPLPPPETPHTPKKNLWQKIVVFMDFDLLRCPIYLNLVLGLSLVYVAEQNFKTVLPFFFQSIGYDKKDIALFLSVQAFTDILARLILPPIFDKMAISKRSLFMIGIFSMGVCRSVLVEQTDWTMIIIWLFVCGFVRGVTLINYTITIAEYSSNYSTMEKLPAAFGLHMVGKGMFVVVIGPMLGIIRDYTKSFPVCIHSQTFLLMLGFVAWCVEYLVMYLRRKNTSQSDTNT